MNTIKSDHISIQNGETTRIDNREHRKLSLVCREGVAWITTTGDGGDYVIKPGEVLEIDARREGIVVGSISPRLELDVISA
ncbi:MAG TPA: DUF2917 domain-containing protein [Bdellovibrionales bacterium]|nr:DUF2917 domain-containing protein [Bdellovibrionales bacterium]